VSRPGVQKGPVSGVIGGAASAAFEQGGLLDSLKTAAMC